MEPGSHAIRNRVSADDDYEAEHFARENGVTIEQGRELIKANGNDREGRSREGIAGAEVRITTGQSSPRRSISNTALYAGRISTCTISARCFIMQSRSIGRFR